MIAITLCAFSCVNWVRCACRHAVIQQLTPSCWKDLPGTLQTDAVNALATSAAADPSQTCREAALAATKLLPLEASHLIPTLTAMTASGAHTVTSEVGTTEQESTASATRALLMQTAVPVLELLLWKDDVKNVQMLLGPVQVCLPNSLPSQKHCILHT